MTLYTYLDTHIESHNEHCTAHSNRGSMYTLIHIPRPTTIYRVTLLYILLTVVCTITGI